MNMCSFIVLLLEGIMQVSYMNGRRLRSVLIAGGMNLISREDHLNHINVFPVPDGDTGTNMSGTMEEILGVLVESENLDLESMSRLAADSAIMGAKGNSGTIVAQFLQGMAVSLKDQVRVTTRSFGLAVRKAVTHTYQAVTNPREGTILTVLREWGEAVYHASRQSSDFVEVHHAGLTQAKVSLENTREQLAELKKAGVVDAGAQGFVDLLEGISGFMKSSKIREFYGTLIGDFKRKSRKRIESSLAFVEQKLTFRYCSEFIVKGKELALEQIRRQLISMGDSLIVAGSNQLAKIHIHTDHPYEVNRILNSHGSIEKSKVDDMKEQLHDAHQPHGESVIVVDSTCDLSDEEIEKLGIHVVSLTVRIGDEAFLDRQTINHKRFYSLLRRNPDAPVKTAQPSIGEFLRKFNFLKSHYKSILFLSVSGKVSGTLQNGITAAKMIQESDPGYPIEVVDSQNGSVGIGVLARHLAKLAADGCSVERLTKIARKKVSGARIFAVLPSLDRLLKGGRLSRAAVRFLSFFHLRPILGNSPDGVIRKEKLFFNKNRSSKALLKKVISETSREQSYEWVVGHVDNLTEAKYLESELRKVILPDDELVITPVGSSMTGHSGFGALAISYMEAGE